ncbi:MAG: hypothetical protein J6Q81_04805, partial [Lentisphaeria bacterium]|nr:hypothetical protein [Lentisphaeria bacterium]
MNFDTIYVEMLNQKIEELKYVTSNQDVNNGAAPSGITAASAIAAAAAAAAIDNIRSCSNEQGTYNFLRCSGACGFERLLYAA